MRTLIVTGGDEAFMPLLRGLVLSLHQWRPRPFTELACLDVGLSAQSRDWMAQYARHILEPRWDLPIAPDLRQREPHLRTLTARPFLRDYFPGYDLYLWIDADAWVQEPYALEWFFKAASTGGLAIASERDRSYTRHDPGAEGWRQRGIQAFFGRRAVEEGHWNSYFNCGLFALPGSAPHWQLWARYFREGLEHAQGSTCSDQAAMNHMLWREQPPLHPLPALCNWLCHLCVPAFRPAHRKFCEPFVPWTPVGVMHLAGSAKTLVMKLPDANGQPDADLSLRFPEQS